MFFTFNSKHYKQTDDDDDDDDDDNDDEEVEELFLWNGSPTKFVMGCPRHYKHRTRCKLDLNQYKRLVQTLLIKLCSSDSHHRWCSYKISIKSSLS